MLIALVVNGCPNLEQLSLWGCKQLSDRAVVALASACPSMVNLNVRGCSGLTHKLTRLNIRANFMVTQEAIQALISACPGLGLASLDHESNLDAAPQDTEAREKARRSRS